MDFREQFLSETLARFRYYKHLGDGALTPLTDADLHWTPDAHTNSIAVIVRHLAGNMRSRWTDFLTTDGEKADRDRDTEFEDDGLAKAGVLERWEDGWRSLLGAMAALTPDDVGRTVTIRSEPLSVVSAIQRQLAHVPYHIGQIVLLARSRRGDAWESLSIPKGNSAAFNAQMDERAKR